MARGRRLNVPGLENRFDQFPGLGVYLVLERARQGCLGLLASAERPGFSWFWRSSILSVATLLAFPGWAKRAVVTLGKIFPFLVWAASGGGGRRLCGPRPRGFRFFLVSKNVRAMIGTLWAFCVLPACLPCRIVAFRQMALPRHHLLVKYYQAATVSRRGTDHAQEEEKEAEATTGEAELPGQVCRRWRRFG